MEKTAAKKEGVGHTPGPWSPCNGGVAGADGKLVAQSVHYCESSESPHARWYFDNGEANALLISAAPELLEACMLAADWESGKDVGEMTSDKVLAILRAVIAKVYGR